MNNNNKSFFDNLFENILIPIVLPFYIVNEVYEYFRDFNKVKKGIVILGMTGSGKTTIYNYYLNGTSEGQTSTKEYDQFLMDIGDRKILIKKGKDIAGGVEFFQNQTVQNMISNSETDIIFFVFDAFNYLNDNEYLKDTNARIENIFRKNNKQKYFYIVGSFLDKFKDRNKEQVVKDIKNKISGEKDYETKFTDGSFELLKLNDNKKGLDNYFNNIFNIS